MPARDPFGDFLRRITGTEPPEDETQDEEEENEEEPEDVDTAEPVRQTFDWLDVPDEQRDAIEEKLRDAQPEGEKQGLFYLGWMADVSPDVRKRARDAYIEQYGEFDPRTGKKSLSSENWRRWRNEIGSPPLSGEAA